MRAIVVNVDQRNVRIAQRQEPRRPRGTEVLLRPIEVGICGTDREIVAFEHGAPPPGSSELVLGHEALAEIVEVGPDVMWARPGGLVVPMVRRPCPNPRCAACRAGRPEYCSTGEFSERGIVHADGLLSELALEEERYLVPVPRALEDVAVLVEPLSVVAKAAEEFAAIHARFGFDIPRPRGLVLGAGPVGLLAAMTLRAGDIDTYVFSREAEDSPRAELIRSLEATYVSAAHTPLERLPERIGTVDDVFEAVGVAEVAFGALPTLAANGVLVMSGIPAQRGPVPAELSRWMRDLVLKNQVVLGTVNASRSAFESAVHRLEQFMALFPDAVRSLIARSPFEQAPDVLTRGRGIKDVIRCGAAATGTGGS
jgi:threonine dehydrogenase-like Zn-dependent dehydrogenase